MLYVINNNTYVCVYKCGTLENAQNYLENNKGNFSILKDINMNYVSSIVYVDGLCIYNNKDFYLGKTLYNNTETSYCSEVSKNFDDHIVLDFSGEQVSIEQYKKELAENSSRLSMLDGRQSETILNMRIGREFIGLFRSEFSSSALDSITKYMVNEKLLKTSYAAMEGAFDLAQYELSLIEKDDYLNETRINKYIQMLNVADVYTYAS